MKTIVIFLSFLLINNLSFAQVNPGKDHSKMKLSCTTCHTCEVPTRNDPCLIACPREKIVTIYQKPEETPELIVIDRLKDKYGSVYFSHRIHAQMSEMSGGCGGCHHYNTTGPILNCNSCHEASRKREDISLPDLKGAYHRQCMDCHREWSHKTGCNSCHLPADKVTGTDKEQIEKRLKGKDHPVIHEPEKIVYKTDTNKGKFATFYHDDHTKKFNLKCISCHKQESCSSCHDANRKTSDEGLKKNRKSPAKLTFDQQHKKCISCHQNQDCRKCHSNEELKPFDHFRTTGWKLEIYHAILDCNKCHGSDASFKGLNKNCSSCHSKWSQANFKHEVTGLKLDEIHIEFSCEDCHADNNYSAKPACENCHEDYVYPEVKPGKLIKK